jgi:hypothetical protein
VSLNATLASTNPYKKALAIAVPAYSLAPIAKLPQYATLAPHLMELPTTCKSALLIKRCVSQNALYMSTRINKNLFVSSVFAHA